MPGGGGITVDIERRSARSTWGAVAEVAHVAQQEEGGLRNGRMDGYYTVGVRREFKTARANWWSELRLQPGFGDVRGTNIALAIRAEQ
jgi:hypothetical protein